jgi:hypothetical protein
VLGGAIIFALSDCHLISLIFVIPDKRSADPEPMPWTVVKQIGCRKKYLQIMSNLSTSRQAQQVRGQFTFCSFSVIYSISGGEK